MQMTRRQAVSGLAALGLAGCAGGGALEAPVARASDPGMQPVPDPGWQAWAAAFRERAAGQGIAPAVLEAAFRDAGYLPGVVERDRNQTEFTRSLEDYLAIAASDERVATGRAMAARHAALLGAIEARYGVDARIVTAIWGLESRYGERRGDIPVVSATSTLAYDGRRGAFFETQLLAALRIVQAGDVEAGRLRGSWAGAMGHTQFIPTSYLAYAVDFTGDGRRDIWAEDPADALASTAAYLSRSGWRRGEPWGVEVTLPPGFPPGLVGRDTARSAGDWAALGVRRAGGGAPGDHGPASILVPQGPDGPAFLTYPNYAAIARYNNAQNYVIGVGHLGDRIAGGAPIRAGFPDDAYGLSIEDRRALQRRLTASGFDAGGSDGVIGEDTRAAIRAYEARAGLPVTGEPSRALLAALG